MSRRSKPHKAPAAPTESRLAETVTVFWLLSVLTTLVCEVVSLGIWIVSVIVSGGEGRAALVARLLLFAAMVTGMIGLAVTPVVLKQRRVPPPRGITIFSFIICAAPLMAALLLELQKHW